MYEIFDDLGTTLHKLQNDFLVSPGFRGNLSDLKLIKNCKLEDVTWKSADLRQAARKEYLDVTAFVITSILISNCNVTFLSNCNG